MIRIGVVTLAALAAGLGALLLDPDPVRALGPPRHPAAVAGRAEVGLEWEPVEDALDYQVRWSTDRDPRSGPGAPCCWPANALASPDNLRCTQHCPNINPLFHPFHKNSNKNLIIFTNFS